MAALLFLCRNLVLDSFSALSPETRALTDKFILVLSLGLILRCIPMMAIVGVLRAGGDVKFCLYQDLVAQWLIGIPLAAVAAIYWEWKPEAIYVLFLTEELVKWGGSIYRVKSKKWLKNLIEN
ncbi:Na+ driven multidrug efflux pump [Vibrio ponticus]|nr:Na+ driven multidrug efflux pump [Vibrio ponticus]